MKQLVTPFLLLAVMFCKAGSIPTPAIIKKLLLHQGQVITFPLSNALLFPELNINHHSGQLLTKTPQGLYLSLPGTGRLYKLTENKGQLEYKRIDSTLYEGYNFGCLNFSLNSTLYSFGGEGFWHTNGDLRVFNELSHEWNAVRVSDPIARAFHFSDLERQFYFIDTALGELWITGPRQSPHFLKDLSKHDVYPNQLWSLQLSTGQWSYKGILEKNEHFLLAQTPWGLFNKYVFLDPLKNKIYSLKNPQKIYAWFSNSSQKQGYDLSYCIDSTIYIGNFSGSLDSLQISSSDISNESSEFYKVDGFKNKYGYFLLLAGSILTGLIFWINKNRKRKGQATFPVSNKIKVPEPTEIETKIENPKVYRAGKEVNLLGGNEINLLRHLYNNSAKGWTTSIEEINTCLGTTKRTVEIQKRLRGDLINAINEKLSLLSHKGQPVIEKKRSEEDKRTFEYFIQSNNFELVLSIIKEKE